MDVEGYLQPYYFLCSTPNEGVHAMLSIQEWPFVPEQVIAGLSVGLDLVTSTLVLKVVQGTDLTHHIPPVSHWRNPCESCIDMCFTN